MLDSKYASDLGFYIYPILHFKYASSTPLPCCLKIKGIGRIVNKIVKNHETKNFFYQSVPNHPVEWSRMHIRPPRSLPATSGRISKKNTLQNWCNLGGVACMGRKQIFGFCYICCPYMSTKKWSYFLENHIFWKIWINWKESATKVFLVLI